MYKIAVIDDKASALGFKAIGLSVFPADSADAARDLLVSLSSGDFAVIYIAEHLAKQIKEEIAVYQDKLTPAVILIPSASGSEGLGMAALKASVERAVGADILNT